MESTRSVGYSFESAVSDIVDNSISAEAENVWIESLPGENPFVAILDDGVGLGQEDLEEAMRYGTDPKAVRDKNDLGRFGLGMKIASLSQCRKLTVVSVRKGSVSACRWDLDRVLETDRWTLQVLSDGELDGLPKIEKLRNMPRGTLVVWENMDKLRERSGGDISTVMAKSLSDLKSHLCLTFHRFMDVPKKPVNIFLNGDKLKPCDPFLTKNTQTKALPEEIVKIEGEDVAVKAFILPVESKLAPDDIDLMGGLSRTLQGFWVYRNKRLIIPGTWFKLTNKKELTKLARVRVDLPNTLDSVWDIDVKKSSAVIPMQFRNAFLKVLDSVTGNSEERYKFRGRKENDKNIVSIWSRTSYQKMYSYHVNTDHPLIRDGYNNLSQDSRKWFREVIKLIETWFPYNDMFNLMSEAKLGNVSQPADQDIDEVYLMGVRLLTSGTSMEDIRKMQPFAANGELLKKLEEFNGKRKQD